MHARGTITLGMRRAGEQFAEWMERAHRDGVRAIDLQNERADYTKGFARGGDLSAEIHGMRRQVWQAVLRVGGIDNPAGSALWHVVGLRMSVKEWVRNGPTGVVRALKS